MAQLSTKRILNAREEVLVSLRKQHGGLMKKIKTERKKLDSFKEDIRVIVNTSQGVIQKKFEELRNAKNMYKAVLERCTRSKIFNKQEKKELFWLKEDLDELSQEMFGDAMEMSEEDYAEMVRRAAEERHKRGFDVYEQFVPPVPEEQQKSIREVYKRLAARFHPDKAAGNLAAEQRFHTIMQRINTSYQRGDIADLLAIEVEYSDVADILLQADSPLVDVVEQEIERVRLEIELCQTQLSRLKSERKNIEKTNEGKMVKDFKRAEKLGLDPIAEMTQDFDRSIAAFSRQRELFEKTLNGIITKEQLMQEMAKLGDNLEEDFEEDEAFMPFGEEMTQEELMMILSVMEEQINSYGNGRGKGGGGRGGRSGRPR